MAATSYHVAQRNQRRALANRLPPLPFDTRTSICVAVTLLFGSPEMSVPADDCTRMTTRRVLNQLLNGVICEYTLMSFTYLAILWLCGGLLSAFTMFILLLQLDKTPQFFGKGTHIGGTPHVVFEPNPNRFDVRTKGVIKFRTGEAQTYNNLMVRYRLLLRDEYNNTSLRKCTTIKGVRDGAPTNDSVCHVEAGSREIYKECALNLRNINNGMGFGSGEPCIMLRLTRILGWYPEDPVDSESRTCSDGSAQCCNRMRLQFNCESAVGSATTEMIPSDGMSTCTFPFWNEPNFEQGFVMMKVKNMAKGKNEIRCRPAHKSIQLLDDGHDNVAQIIIEKEG